MRRPHEARAAASRRGFGVAAAAVLALSGCGERAPELGPALTLAEAGGSNPTAAVDADGRAYVTWVGTDEEGRSDVWLSVLPRRGRPGAPVRVNDVPGDAAPHLQAPAQVAVGASGEVYVVWTNNAPVPGRRFPASNLRFARSADGGRSFEPALTVNDDAGGTATSHTFHDVAVTRSGAIVVSWLDGREGPEAAGPDVRLAVSTDGGGTFSASHVANHVTCPCCRTALALGPDGALYVAWRELFPGDVRDVVVARSDDLGRTWTEPVRVAPDGWVFPGCPHAGPSLLVDGGGTLHVSWYTGREGEPGLYYTTSADGGRTFAPAVPLLADDWVPPSQTAMAEVAGGALWLAWEDRRTADGGFRWLEVAPGSALSPGSAHGSPGTNPVLASGGDRVVLAWLEDDRVLARTGVVR